MYSSTGKTPNLFLCEMKQRDYIWEPIGKQNQYLLYISPKEARYLNQLYLPVQPITRITVGTTLLVLNWHYCNNWN